MGYWTDTITSFFGFGQGAPAEGGFSEATSIPRLATRYVMGGFNLREEQPVIDFTRIDQAFQEESYVMQAVTRYVELIFKSDWVIKSKDAKALTYVQRRIKEISKNMGHPFEMFMIELATNLVKYNNCFYYKMRESKTKRLSSFFVLDTPNTRVRVDGDLRPKFYRQYEGSTSFRYRDFPAADTEHVTHNRPSGRIFGIPFMMPVLDDIRLLRSIEASLIKSIHRNIEPLVQHIIGTDSRPTTNEEIEMVQGAVNNMPLDGQLVTSHRHQIKVHGADGEALSIEKYLRYFEQRVITGLGMSETAFGRASTSNKATAEQLSKELHDRIKAYQRILAFVVNFKIIDEIMAEAEAPATQEEVYLEFNEIDFDFLIKKENHIIFKFTANIATEDETREALGELPIKEAERKKLFANLYNKVSSGADAANRNQPRNQHTPSASGSAEESENPFRDPSLLTTQTDDQALLDVERRAQLSRALMRAYEAVWSDVGYDRKLPEKLNEAAKIALGNIKASKAELSYLLPAVDRLGKALLAEKASDGQDIKRVFMLGQYLLKRVISSSVMPSRLSA